MKKLMIALTAVVMAVGVQAASVNWTSGGFSSGFTGPDGKTMKGATGYTMTVMIYSDLAGTTLLDTSTDDSPNGGGAFTGGTADVLTADKDYFAKAIITDGSNTRESAIAEFHTPATGTPTLSFLDGSNFKVTGAKWGEWQSVPEPTSGLLLLIGVAGLALRRRRA